MAAHAENVNGQIFVTLRGEESSVRHICSLSARTAKIVLAVLSVAVIVAVCISVPVAIGGEGQTGRPNNMQDLFGLENNIFDKISIEKDSDNRK